MHAQRLTAVSVAQCEARWPEVGIVYEQRYCARGEMENRIKERQLALSAGRASAETMRANQVRLYFSTFAYQLLHGLRRPGLPGAGMAQAQCQTIRLRLLKTRARIRVTVRKVWLPLAAGHRKSHQTSIKTSILTAPLGRE